MSQGARVMAGFGRRRKEQAEQEREGRGSRRKDDGRQAGPKEKQGDLARTKAGSTPTDRDEGDADDVGGARPGAMQVEAGLLNGGHRSDRDEGSRQRVGAGTDQQKEAMSNVQLSSTAPHPATTTSLGPSSASSSSPPSLSIPNTIRPSLPRLSLSLPIASPASSPASALAPEASTSKQGLKGMPSLRRQDLHLVLPTAAPSPSCSSPSTSPELAGSARGAPGLADMDDVMALLTALRSGPLPSALDLLESIASSSQAHDDLAPDPVPVGDVLAPDANDASTREMLEHLHPSDLKSLAEALRHLRHPSTPPTDTDLAHSFSPHPNTNVPLIPGPSDALDIRPVVPSRLLQVQRPQGGFKRKMKRKEKRQATQGDGSGPSAQGYPSCEQVGNAVLSCYPQSSSMLVQNVWSKFIWNNRYPTFVGSSYVDIYLYNADSETVVSNWTHVANNRGMIGILPQDSWLPVETQWNDGANVSIPYFFVITDSGSALTGAEQHQATFTVVQTAAPSTLIAASLSSASGLAAASLSSVLSSMSSAESSLRSVASASASAFGSSAGTSGSAGVGGNTGTGGLQNGSGDSDFPKWAIALIVVLGVLALIAFLIALYLFFVAARRKRQIRSWSDGAPSYGSRSPILRGSGGQDGAGLMTGVGTGLVAGAAAGRGKDERPQSGSTRNLHSPYSSRPGSPLSAAELGTGAGLGVLAAGRDGSKRDSGTVDSHEGPISSADASRMAEAFRKALRKPEFPPSSGDPTPESSTGNDPFAGGAGGSHKRESMQAQLVDPERSASQGGSPRRGGDAEEPEAKEIMDKELASEGRSMASLEARRQPEVHDS